MRASVTAGWPVSIRQYEGVTNWLYWDTHVPPLPTTGTGNMIGTKDGLSAFGLALPWRTKLGDYATEASIADEAQHLRSLNLIGSGYAYEKYATLFLDQPVVDWLLGIKTREMWDVLAGRFKDIELWPADAQLALLNMAWWMGPNFLATWPKLTDSLSRQDWLGASKQCTTVNPSQRNPDNVLRFQTAARVKFAGLDPEPLWNPNEECADHPVIPPHPLSGGALLSVSAAKVQWAFDNPTTAGVNGWYAQRMLKLLGFYTGPLDGLCGAQTAAALRKYVGSTVRVTATVLTKLSDESGLRMPVAA